MDGTDGHRQVRQQTAANQDRAIPDLLDQAVVERDFASCDPYLLGGDLADLLFNLGKSEVTFSGRHSLLSSF